MLVRGLQNAQKDNSKPSNKPHEAENEMG